MTTTATDNRRLGELTPTFFIDSEHPDVVAFARASADGSTSPREQAVRLFLAVRDGIRYDPYSLTLIPEDYKASAVLARGAAWCVPKAILLAAACRAMGIPARLGFADVRNHLTSQKLFEAMKTDVFAFHGYTSMWIDGAWRKATSAFNKTLCEKFGVKTLEFDGHADAMLQPFDTTGRRHMEYLRYRGESDDFPFDAFVAAMREFYPHWFAGQVEAPTGRFEDDGRFDDAPGTS